MFGNNKKLYVVEFNKQINHNSVKQFYKDMEFVRKHKNKSLGVIIRLNCPGGSPSLSYEVAEYIKDFQKDVNVHIYVESMAASGGYFVAAAGKKIYANPFAIIGSIGVIMQKVEVSGLADKIGIQEDNISVGEFKQPLSLFKPIDDEGEQYLKNQLMTPTYNMFVNYVAENRNIGVDAIKKKYADGRIFVAHEVGTDLVDEVKTFHSLIKELVGTEKPMEQVEFVNTVKKTFKDKLGFNFNLRLPQLENNRGLSLS